MNRRVFLISVFCLSANLATSQGQERNHAFFVGVETYDPVFLNRLNYAEDDAIELGAEFKRLGYRVTLMTREEEIPARRPSTAKSILSQLKLWLSTKRDNETVVVGLSGHGVQFREPQKLSDGTEDDQFFCPETANLRDVNTLVSMKKVFSLLESCKAQRKLLLVDACRNEVLSDVAKSGKEIELDPAGVTPRTVPKGLVALYSCAQGEKSYELHTVKHGAFCYQVLKFLRGEAPSAEYRDEKIGLRRLLDYASTATRMAVFEQLSKDQYPETVGRTTDWEIGVLPTRKEKTNSIGMKLKLIPAGQFRMGSKESPQEINRAFPSESVTAHENQVPQHQVTISRPFYMGVHEVTMAQFRAFANDTRYRTDVEKGTGRNNPTGTGTSVAAKNWRNPGHPGLTENHPVTVVSWNDAQAFCQWLSRKEGTRVRLPTQAEWEYACRAGTTTRYSSGDDPESLVTIANVPNRSEKFTMSFQVNQNVRLVTQFDQGDGELTFSGSWDNGFFIKQKTTGNQSPRVTIYNDMQTDSVTIRTKSGDVTIAGGGSRSVSLPVELEWLPLELEYYSDADNKWLKLACDAGSLVAFRPEDQKWLPEVSYPAQAGMDSGNVIVRNLASSSEVPIRVNGRQQTVAPRQEITIQPGEVRNSNAFIEGRDGFAELAPVGQLLPNAFGLHDMHGNVWEWCQDGLDGYVYSQSPKVDPVGPATSKRYAIRGGCFL